MSNAPLLAAENLRIDLDGAVAIEGASFESRGNSVVLLGDADGLVAAIAGKATVRSGTLALLGSDVERRAHLEPSVVGLAPLDPPLPPRWTAREYLVWGARLAGSNRAAAQKEALATLSDLGLEALTTKLLEELTLGERRALVLAQAVAAKPAVLIASAPLTGLSGPDAPFVAAVLAAATRHRKWIISLSNPHAGSPENVLATAADDVLVFASGRLLRHGKLQRIEDGTIGYTLMLRGEVAAFRDALHQRGVELSGGPHRFFLELPPEVRAQDLLMISLEVGAPIIELVPRILLPP
ncbi:MAG TPA: ATP-binding cassette domain-containing protein [Polyangiaceae bacterium]